MARQITIWIMRIRSVKCLSMNFMVDGKESVLKIVYGKNGSDNETSGLPKVQS